MRRYNVISADGHLEIPPEMYTGYLPAKYRDAAPRTLARPNGNEYVKMGEHEFNLGMVIRGDLDDDVFVKVNGDFFHNPDGSYRPGVGTAAQRLREQDIDGLDAEVLYPPVSGPRYYKTSLLPKEPEMYRALIASYNTWLAKEYCATAPDRLIGNGMVPETGVEDAIAEAQRCAKMGIVSMCLSSWPNGSGYYQPGDEKFFAAMADLNMVVSPHSSFGSATPKAPQGGEGSGIDGVLYHRAAGPAFGVTQLFVNGIFDAVPNSKVYIAETYTSYLPFNYNRMDEHYIRRRHYYNFKLKKLPSEYIRDNMAFSFIAERVAMPLRYYTGLDTMMWGSDFPHNVNTYPHSKVVLQETFLDVPEDEKRRILVSNPCKWFHLDPEKELTATPAGFENYNGRTVQR